MTQTEQHEQVYPEPWKKEQHWCLKDARDVAKLLVKRTDITAVRLIRFDKDEVTDVLSINDIVEIETQFNRDKYPYGSGVDRRIKEWCAEGYLFSFETVKPYDGVGG